MEIPGHSVLVKIAVECQMMIIDRTETRCLQMLGSKVIVPSRVQLERERKVHVLFFISSGRPVAEVAHRAHHEHHSPAQRILVQGPCAPRHAI